MLSLIGSKLEGNVLYTYSNVLLVYTGFNQTDNSASVRDSGAKEWALNNVFGALHFTCEL